MNTSYNQKGLFWGFVSYSLWGFFPVYWKLLQHVPALEILAHRMVWSFVFYLGIFLFISHRDLRVFLSLSKKDWLLSTLAAVLLTFNWGIYIYAVNSGHILEGSLAYFINPILNVAVGVLFFKEEFPWILRLSVGAAAIGVGIKILFSIGLPWMSLALAFSFCAYGVTKKTLTIPPRTSSLLEGAIGVIPAMIAVMYFESQKSLSMDAQTWILLALGGVVTGLPLFLFSFAAQRIPYSVMGVLQFIAPSLQFLVAVSMFGETLSTADLAAFVFIWIGMIFYLVKKAT